VKIERRGVTRIEAIRSTRAPQPRWPLLTIRLLAGLGLLVSTYLTILHLQAGANGAIESPFCGAGTVINCTSVLGSPYARLFGMPVAGWAAATYAFILLLSFLGQPALLVLLCGWSFAFSLYMASLSLLVVKHACLFCMTLYAVNIGLLIGAIALARARSLFTGQQAFFSALGYAVLIAGFGWTQSQTASAVTAETAPLPAPAPTAIDEGFLKFYNSQKIVSLSGEERHVKGAAQPLLTVSEFADFRCPQCAHARLTFKQLMDGNPNTIRLIFHHYPLDSSCNPHMSQQVHPGSCAASIAAECAGEQGKFWEYADLLFSDQKEYTKDEFSGLAGKLGLDVGRFQTCLDDGKIKEYIRKDIEEAERLGIKATPTLIINGHFIEGLPTPQKLASLITVEKQRAGKK
jgi:protein-disulfide isomerase